LLREISKGVDFIELRFPLMETLCRRALRYTRRLPRAILARVQATQKEGPDPMYDNQNIFARILRGELPCFKIYEDADTIAFMDIMPQTDGHALVVPKEQAVDLFGLSEAGAAAAIKSTQRVARAVREAFQPDGMVITQFNGVAAGQTVPHIHFHIVPRYADQPIRGHAREQQDMAVLKEHAERVIAALANLAA
jgi:histidine triad (HIT) family protein